MNLHEPDPLQIIGVVLLFIAGLVGARKRYPNNPHIVWWVALGTLILIGCAIAFGFLGRLIQHHFEYGH